MREQGIDVSFAAGNRAGGLPFLKAPTAFLSALAWLDLADNFARIVATGLIVLIDALIHLSRLNIIIRSCSAVDHLLRAFTGLLMVLMW